MSGSVRSLFLKPTKGKPMLEVSEFEVIQGMGIRGDASFGQSSRQVLLAEADILTGLGLQPGDVRENITVVGFEFGKLNPGDLISIGEAVLEITSECAPCKALEGVRPGLMEEIRGNRGLLAKVIHSSRIKQGDPVLLP